MEIPEGYLSHLMCNTDGGKVVFDNPLVFMSNIPFRNFKDIIPLLEYSTSNSRPLVIICKGMESSAMNNIVMNLLNKTIECAAILAPNFGDAQIDELGDIQSMLGGTVFNHESKDDSTTFVASDLGTCSKVIITKEKTTFVGGEGDTSDKIASLRETVEDMKGHEAARIKSRIARLKGGVATIRVGASSSIEMREKKERLDDALNATRAALQEGIVIGGGITLSKVAQELVSEDNDLGWFVKAMVQPIQVLLDNSGQTFVNDIYKNSAEFGFNALTGEFCNLEEAGVFDPVKVTKNSFLAAMSIASLFYSTDVAVLIEE